MANRELKERVATLENDVEKLKSDVAGLRSNVAPVKADEPILEEYQPERTAPSGRLKIW